MTTSADNVPTHLRAATRRWYVAVLEDYDLESHHQRLLQAACEAWDQLQEAREVLRKEGTYVGGRYGPRAHPRSCGRARLADRIRPAATGA